MKLRPTIAIGAIACLAFMGVVATGTSAQATVPQVKATASCNIEGTFDITWQVSGDPGYAAETATVVSQSVATTPTFVGQSVKDTESVTGIQAGVVPGNYSLTVQVQWTNHAQGDLVSATGSIKVKGDCYKNSDITFCHATASNTNPYNMITTNTAAFYNAGHIDHTGDIFPAGSFVHNGVTQSWAAQGDQSLLAYPDCSKPVVVPPTEVTPAIPTPVDVCGTVNDGFGPMPSTEGIIYTRDGGDIVATLADNTHAFKTPLPSGWVNNGDGTATYAFSNVEWTNVPCEVPSTIPVELCNSADGYLNPDEGGLMPEQTPGGLLLDGPSLIHFPISGYTLANLPNPTMVVDVTTGSTPFMKVETTAPYSTLNYFGGGLWGTTKIAYSSPGGMGNPIPAADLVGKWNYTSSTVPYSFGVGYANDTGNTAVVKSLSFGGTTYDFVCVTKVVPSVPVVKDLCGTVNDHYGLPTDTEGIAYTRDGLDIIATLKGDQYGFGTLPSGYVDNHDGTATYAFSNTDWSTAPCITIVIPGIPTVNDSCGTSNDQFDLPTTEGIVYTRDGHDIVATPADATHALGTLPSGWVDNGNGSATYAFLNVEWSSAPCPIEDTPGTVVFSDTCGVDNDTYTVPAIPDGANWQYEVNGKAVTAGTYPATGKVTVVAVPNDQYSFLDGVQTSWSHDFTNVACPPTLAFTGSNPTGLISLIVGLMLSGLTLLGVRYRWFAKLAGWWRRRKTIVSTPIA